MYTNGISKCPIEKSRMQFSSVWCIHGPSRPQPMSHIPCMCSAGVVFLFPKSLNWSRNSPQLMYFTLWNMAICVASKCVHLRSRHTSKMLLRANDIGEEKSLLRFLVFRWIHCPSCPEPVKELPGYCTAMSSASVMRSCSQNFPLTPRYLNWRQNISHFTAWPLVWGARPDNLVVSTPLTSHQQLRTFSCTVCIGITHGDRERPHAILMCFLHSLSICKVPSQSCSLIFKCQNWTPPPLDLFHTL